MNTTLQPTRHAWAFLINTRKKLTYKRTAGKPAPKRHRYQYMIIACSKEAKVLGIQTGMRYDEARNLVPELRVLVCNG